MLISQMLKAKKKNIAYAMFSRGLVNKIKRIMQKKLPAMEIADSFFGLFSRFTTLLL